MISLTSSPFAFFRHGKHYELSLRCARALWPNERYLASDVDPPSACVLAAFGDFAVRVPGNAGKYLARTYGPDWARAGRGPDYDHTTKEWVSDPAEFGLEGRLLEPARPFR